jgi:hypothetical protein
LSWLQNSKFNGAAGFPARQNLTQTAAPPVGFASARGDFEIASFNLAFYKTL